METVWSKYVWPAVRSQLEVFVKIWELFAGVRNYAVIVNVRGTDGCEVCGRIFSSRMAADAHARKTEKSRTFLFLERVRLYSREEFEHIHYPEENNRHVYYVNVYQDIRFDENRCEDVPGDRWLSCNIFRDMPEAKHHAAHAEGRYDVRYVDTLVFMSQKLYKPIEENYRISGE